MLKPFVAVFASLYYGKKTMALFNRNKNKSAKMPPEVQKYYDSEQRERVGLAWLVAFVSLLVTVLVIMAVFFGGRWIFRKVTNDNGGSNTSQTANKPTTSESSSSSEANKTKSDSSSSNSTSKSESSQSSSSKSSSSNNDSGVKAPESEDLSNTGPGNLLEVFAAVTIIATGSHLVYSNHKNRRGNL